MIKFASVAVGISLLCLPSPLNPSLAVNETIATPQLIEAVVEWSVD